MSVVLLVLATTLWADARESYREGEEALEAGHFRNAARSFESAISERPEPRAKTFLGKRRYLPYLLLGLAREGAGDCAGSLAAFEEAERWGEVQKVADEHAKLTKARSRCQERMRAFQTEVEELDARKSRVEGRLRAVEALAASEGAQGVVDVGSPSASDRLGWIRELLEQAAAGRAEGLTTQDENRLVDADRLLDEAEGEMKSLESDLNAGIAAGKAQQEDVTESLARAVRSAGRILGSVEGFQPYPEELGRRIAGVQKLLADVEALPEPAPAGRASKLHQELSRETSRLRRAARPPPEPLIQKAEALLMGRWTEVLAEDPGEDTSWREDPQAAAFGCMIEAAAQHAIATLRPTEEIDDEAVRARIAECQQTDEVVTLPESYLSPRFIALWQEVAAEVAAAEETNSSGDEASRASVASNGDG